MPNVNYTHQFYYRYDLSGNLAPIIPINLKRNSESVDIPMIIDTGTSSSIIQGEYAKILNIDILEGQKKVFSVNNGQEIQAYGHEVLLTVEGYSFNIFLYFAMGKALRNLLGRDILSFLQLGIRENENTFYLSLEP